MTIILDTEFIKGFFFALYIVGASGMFYGVWKDEKTKWWEPIVASMLWPLIVLIHMLFRIKRVR
jgi:cell shape-determining protein MreD